MTATKQIYLVALLVTLLFYIFIKVNNPHREYSTKKYWETASIASVSEIPDEALALGNKNGPIIMWAAIGSSDPRILVALSERGIDINESDGIFKGTPLTGAAGYSENPQMIMELINLGADINKTVHNEETALMIAAQYNTTPGILTMLINNGARIDRINSNGKTALDLAKINNNETAINELELARENIR